MTRIWAGFRNETAFIQFHNEFALKCIFKTVSVRRIYSFKMQFSSLSIHSTTGSNKGQLNVLIANRMQLDNVNDERKNKKKTGIVYNTTYKNENIPLLLIK